MDVPAGNKNASRTFIPSELDTAIFDNNMLELIKQSKDQSFDHIGTSRSNGPSVCNSNQLVGFLGADSKKQHLVMDE